VRSGRSEIAVPPHATHFIHLAPVPSSYHARGSQSPKSRLGANAGGTTYEAFAAAWPHIKDESGYADRINTLPKYMASSTLKSASWGQTTIWNGDLAAAAKALKAEGDGEILIFGSASIVHQLAPHGLVDEYRLMIYPTILGAGKRLFPDGAKSQLSLAECQQLGGCIVLTRYTAV
jgi:dihydrofolate reductase